jgi:polyisoprenoid-binding protein YceI
MSPAKEGLVRFSIDARASLFSVQAFASGIAAVVAHSPKFAVRDIVGEMEFVPETMQDGSLRLTINVGSLEIMDEVSRQDRREIERVMFDEVLQKNVYPRVEYKSSRVNMSKISENVYRANVSGLLTLHGTTRGMDLDAQVVVGEDTLRAQGAFVLSQTDYALKIASVAGGSLKLKDELRCAYFIIGRR